MTNAAGPAGAAAAAAVSRRGYVAIDELLRSHARRSPGQQAIVDLDHGGHDVRSIDFKTLADVVDAVAARLERQGIERGQRVALVCGDVIDTAIVWMALWRIAAVVCPLDDAQLDAGLEALLARIRPRFALVARAADASVTARLAGPGADRASCRAMSYGHWCVDGSSGADIELIADAALTCVRPAARAEEWAVICCTSGSTGHPKIVVHDHASYWLSGQDVAYLLGLTPKDRMLEYRSFSWFSPQILSLAPFLQTGMTLCLSRRFSRSRLSSWIAQHRITVAAGVPTVINLLLAGNLEDFKRSATTLRLITCSSAPLAAETWARFEQATGIPLVSLLGSSEAGWMAGNHWTERKIGTVGPPALNTSLKVLDGDGQVCPPHVAGQITIEGPQLAVGLLDAQGELQPLRGGPHATHDVAETDEEGYLKVLGRTDDLVIRGGVKIAPIDVESWLMAHAAVAEAAVVGVPDPVYGQEAVAFVALRPGAQANVADLALHCDRGLARDKRPAQIHIIDTLPRNPRGKIVRDSLRETWWVLKMRSGRS